MTTPIRNDNVNNASPGNNFFDKLPDEHFQIVMSFLKGETFPCQADEKTNRGIIALNGACRAYRTNPQLIAEKESAQGRLCFRLFRGARKFSCHV